MKKIMFNDKYGLTKAVLEGRKTQTRRIGYQGTFKRFCNCGFSMEGADRGKLCINDGSEVVAKSKYKLGEEVAIAQRYIDLVQNDEFYCLCGIHGMPLECIKYEKGCDNKMFVKADLMPHRIRITNIRIERLRDINEEDSLAEGIVDFESKINKAHFYSITDESATYGTAKKAYAKLIDKLSGKGTWDRNPLVFVYEFELIK
jgi:hypothetical protein